MKIDRLLCHVGKTFATRPLDTLSGRRAIGQNDDAGRHLSAAGVNL
jgi:hypothetical protein